MSGDRRRARRGFQRPAWLSERGVQWLLRAAPVLVLLLVFAIKSLSMVGVNAAATRAYEDGNYGSSRAGFAQLGFLNVFESWIAVYNRGTAEYQLRDYDAARESFTVALDRAPERYDCRVRLNLVASIEGQADVLAGQQQHSAAAERYEEGLQILAAGNCGEPQGDPSPSPGASDSPEPSPSGDPTDDPSGDPTDNPSGDPTDDPSGDPTSGPSGEPTSGPSGDPTEGPGDEGGDEGEESGQSEEERRREEAERKQEQQQRMEEKAEDQRNQAERKEGDEEEGDDETDEPPSEPQDPAGSEQRQQQLEKQSEQAQQEQQAGRDREGRPDQRSDRPW